MRSWNCGASSGVVVGSSARRAQPGGLDRRTGLFRPVPVMERRPRWRRYQCLWRGGPGRRGARLCCIVVRGPASEADCYASPGGTPTSSAAVRRACCGVCRVSRGGPGFARESLSEVAAAAPVMASPVLGLPAPGGPTLEAGSPVTNDPGSGGWAVASWLLTAAWAGGPACSGHGSPARVAAGPAVPATGSAADPAGDIGGADDGSGHVSGLCRGV